MILEAIQKASDDRDGGTVTRPIPKAQARRIIDINWAALIRAVTSNSSAHAYELFEKAQAASMKVERAHRRFTGRAYRLPVECAAKLFILRETSAEEPKGLKGWLDVATTRSDIVLARALREVLGRVPAPNLEHIDYARDIAGVIL